ncbi:TPA: acyltransferase [Vibrio parahaemolyticus]|nr:acyltransferase [Vibrio parahaemolyticus]
MDKKKRKFRNDINLLRALAVTMVVSYHYQPEVLKSGFIGVDIFLVISGFLMMSILYGRKDKTIFEFYYDRIVRVYPLLLFLVFIVTAFGFVYLTPNSYYTLSKESISSLFSASNIYYSRNFGYFDGAPLQKILLHTWSLGVEFQYYFIFPLLLLPISRFKKPILYWSFITFSLTLLCVVLGKSLGDKSYYSILTRSWELAFGGWAFFAYQVVNKRNYNIGVFFYSLLLVSLILSSYFLTYDNWWPNFQAFFPVFITGVLLAIPTRNLLTDNIVIKKVGLYSYSIYIWHWSILCIFIYFFEDSSISRLGALILTIVVSSMTYEYIEKNITKIKNNKYFFLSLLVVFSLILAFNLVVYKNSGMPNRVSDSVLLSDQGYSLSSDHRCLLPTNGDSVGKCIVGDKENIRAVVIGDSHADALFNVINTIASEKNIGIAFFAKSSCPTILDVKSKRYPSSTCGDFVNNTINAVNKLYSGLPVLIVNRTHGYLYGQTDPARIKNNDNSPDVFFDEQYKDLKKIYSNKLTNTVCSIKSDKIFFLMPTPEIGMNVPKTLGRELMLNDPNLVKDIKIPIEVFNNQISNVESIYEGLSKSCGVQLISTVENYCDEKYCYGSIGHRPLYYDGDHLNDYGALRIKRKLESVFE